MFSLRSDGLRITLNRAWVRVFGVEEYYLFVRHLAAPAAAVELPLLVNGVTLREVQDGDLDEVARLFPFDLLPYGLRDRRRRLQHHLADGFVAVRDGRVVGAAWYLAQVTPDQSFYAVVQPHVLLPARVTRFLLVIPGEKAAAWVISKHATERLATQGVRTIVSRIPAYNKPSMLVARMLGAKMVGREVARYRFGCQQWSTEPVGEAQAFNAGTAKDAGRGPARRAPVAS